MQDSLLFPEDVLEMRKNLGVVSHCVLCLFGIFHLSYPLTKTDSVPTEPVTFV